MQYDGGDGQENRGEGRAGSPKRWSHCYAPVTERFRRRSLCERGRIAGDPVEGGTGDKSDPCAKYDSFHFA